MHLQNNHTFIRPQPPLNCNLEGCCRPLPDPDPSINLDIVQRNPQTAALLFKSLGMLGRNIRSIATDFINHALAQPKKPSWDIRLAMFVSVSQQVTSHAHLGDLTIARLFSFAPSMLSGSRAVITTTSFRVKTRGLKGILEKFDREENGEREITGEWVVDKQTWNRWSKMMATRSDDEAEAAAADANGQKKRTSKEKVVYYLHGGAYYLMSAKTHRVLTHRVSKATGQRVFAINYRLAPETRFPGAILDAVYGFLYLTDPEGMAIEPSSIVVMGDSAGGGLALAMLLYLRDHGMETPGGGVLLSPWVDLTFSGSSWDTNPHFDYLPPRPEEDNPLHPTKLYLGPEQYPHLAAHPYVSPLFAESFEHLPPLLIQHGDSENLYDEISELARRISETETTHVQHECYEDMVHVFHAFSFLEPAQKALESIGWFVRSVVPTVHKYQAQVSKLKHTNHHHPVAADAAGHAAGHTAGHAAGHAGPRADAPLDLHAVPTVSQAAPFEPQAVPKVSQLTPQATPFRGLATPGTRTTMQLRMTKSDSNLSNHFDKHGHHHHHHHHHHQHHKRDVWDTTATVEVKPWTMTATEVERPVGATKLVRV